MTELGSLARVDLREIWQSEDRHFTPWLAEPANLKILGTAVGLELQLEAQEKYVGPFRADIFCRDALDGSWVVIENQLERTDHSHLGQLLTYTAGLEAVTIIWIAERFTDEHRAALDWLNEKTPDGIAFFGLEIELWRIDDSLAAPKFNVVSRPNEWTRAIIQKRSNSEIGQLCLDYWSGVLDLLRVKGMVGVDAKPVRTQHMNYPVGWHDFWLKSYFSYSANTIGVWIACRGVNWQQNFETLLLAQQQIESQFGEPFSYWKKENERASITKLYQEYDPLDRSDWTRQHQLLAEKLAALYHAANPYIQQIEAANIE